MTSSRGSFSTRLLGYIVVGVLLVVFGVLLPLHQHVSAGRVGLVVLVGVVFGLAVAALRSRGRFVAFFGLLFVGAAVWSQVDQRLLPTWFLALVFGALVGADLPYSRLEPAPRQGRATTKQPRTRLLGGRDGGEEDSALDSGLPMPAAEVSRVLEAVRALNGRDRTVVSVFRGAGRFDVGGDAAGAMVVFQSEDRRRWHQVRTPGAASGEVTVTVGGMEGHYPGRETTDLQAAVVAATTWLRDGSRDPRLSWFTQTRREEVVRPPTLEATD